MMVRVLLYGYCTGNYTSRKIQAKTYEDVACRYLAVDGSKHPDHRYAGGISQTASGGTGIEILGFAIWARASKDADAAGGLVPPAEDYDSEDRRNRGEY
jgi:hypothetical protein